MISCILAIASLASSATQPHPPLLSGAFIQLGSQHAPKSNHQLRAMLDKMRAAKLDTVIVQYIQARDCELPETSESFLPARGFDPVGVILDYADRHPGMTVFLGLRLDRRIQSSEDFNDADELRSKLAAELPLNASLAGRLAQHYRLGERASFGGWYLPIEIPNYSIMPAMLPGDDWVTQLNEFTKHLSAHCTGLVPKPVAVSPYFTNPAFVVKQPADYLVNVDGMRQIIIGFLSGTDVSIVMLQDSVGSAPQIIAPQDVNAYVSPFLSAVAAACQSLSKTDHHVDLWLNQECFDPVMGKPDVPTNIERLRAQLAVGQGVAFKRVAFDFPDYLGMRPLYKHYLDLVRSEIKHHN